MVRHIWNYRNESHRTVLASMVEAADHLSVICPYIRAEQVENLLGGRELRSLRVLTLWDIRSFLLGVSEPSALRRLLEFGGEVRTMKAGLHAKVYIGDESALVTSANFTAGGLTNNLECGVFVENHNAVAALADRFNIEWRRAAPVGQEDVVALCGELDRESARVSEALERLRHLEQKLSRQPVVPPAVWTPRVSEVAMELTTDQIGFLERPVRGQGGYQSLLRRLRGNLSGNLLRLTRSDCERVVRYSREYGEGGFQTRLRSIVQLAELFIAE